MSERPDQLQPLSELLRAYSPELSQDFYARMRSRPWQEPRRGAGGQRWAHWWGLGLMIMLAALVVPTVRATVTGWLGRAPDETVVMPESELVEPPATPDRAAPDQAGQIAAVSGLAGWPVAVPAELPEGYRFESIVYDQANALVLVTYLAVRQLDPTGALTETRALTLVQSRRPAQPPFQVAPSALVEPVALGDGPAAYALGAWDSEYDPGRDAFVARWRADLPVANVFWQRGATALMLNTDDPAVSRAALLATAASTR
jgi:hypothetical protein